MLFFIIVCGRIALFSGKGAVLAGDVEYALRKIGIGYAKIDEAKIKEGGLPDFSCLIVPGGYTAVITKALSNEGSYQIREFVREGGGYIGICAGAYIAADTVEVEDRPEGLGIINIRNIRKSGSELRKVKLTNPNHPVAKKCPEEIKIWYQNGPFIVPGEGVEVIATYLERSGDLGRGDPTYGAIVCSGYGEGKVVIFSPHPEGSITWDIKPDKLGTLVLLKNACEWVTKK